PRYLSPRDSAARPDRALSAPQRQPRQAALRARPPRAARATAPGTSAVIGGSAVPVPRSCAGPRDCDTTTGKTPASLPRVPLQSVDLLCEVASTGIRQLVVPAESPVDHLFTRLRHEALLL